MKQVCARAVGQEGGHGRTDRDGEVLDQAAAYVFTCDRVQLHRQFLRRSGGTSEYSAGSAVVLSGTLASYSSK